MQLRNLFPRFPVLALASVFLSWATACGEDEDPLPPPSPARADGGDSAAPADDAAGANPGAEVGPSHDAAAGEDSAASDSTAGKRYRYLAIIGEDKAPMCSMGFGPGADIDAVSLRRRGAPIGYGLKGSAALAPTDPPGAVCDACGGATDRGECHNSGPAAVPRAEGLPDGRVLPAGDSGFIALNAQMLWLQMGSLTADGPAQEILPGDTVQVYEIDRYYFENGHARDCICPPDRYRVYAYVDKDDPASRVELVPIRYQAENKQYCGQGPPEPGAPACGTTELSVP